MTANASCKYIVHMHKQCVTKFHSVSFVSIHLSRVFLGVILSITFCLFHNLKGPGSSPGWSTLKIKELRIIVTPFSFACVTMRKQATHSPIGSLFLGSQCTEPTTQQNMSLEPQHISAWLHDPYRSSCRRFEALRQNHPFPS